MGNRAFTGIWIPAALWLRKDLTQGEKMLYLEIQSLDNDFGCIASNKKLGDIIQLTPTSVSRALKTLESKELISINYENYKTFSGRKIIITPCENDKPPYQNDKGPCENDKHSNTISNIFSNIDTKVSNVGLPASTPTDESSISKRCQLFIEKFNTIRQVNNKKSKFLANPSLCASLRLRLKIYTPAEILIALENACKDEFHLKNNLKYITPEYLLRLKTIERFKSVEESEPERVMVQ